MKVKIIFDIEENEYICFIAGVLNLAGYGKTEQEAVRDFLLHCENNPLFNQKIISQLLGDI